LLGLHQVLVEIEPCRDRPRELKRGRPIGRGNMDYADKALLDQQTQRANGVVEEHRRDVLVDHARDRLTSPQSAQDDARKVTPGLVATAERHLDTRDRCPSTRLQHRLLAE